MAENRNSPYTGSEYTELKKYVGQGLLTAAEQFDKALLALSGGALVVSIAFLKDIAPDFDPDTRCWIVLAWTLFLLSICLTLYSFQASASAFREFERFIDAHHRTPSTAPATFEHRWNRITTVVNYLSLICFVAGGICLATFSYQNLKSKENGMPDKKPITNSQPPANRSKPLVKGAITTTPPAPIQAVPTGDGVAQGGAPTMGPPVGPGQELGAETISPPVSINTGEASPETSPPPSPPKTEE